MEAEICIIVAVAKNGVIGGDNQLVWTLPADLRHFKEVTMGQPIIMGRNTFASIGRPLPGRRNIVVTTQPDFEAPGYEVVHSTEEALKIAQQSQPTQIFVIGGGQIFQQMLPLAHKMYLTQVDAEPQGDIYFNFDPKDWREVSREEHTADAKNAYDYRFIELIRN